MRTASLFGYLASLAFAAGVVGIWQLAANLQIVSPVFLPGPDRAFAALIGGLFTGDLGPATLATLRRMALGWLIASALGIALGAFVGTSPRARAYLAPMLEVLRPLPASSLIPVFIALFGLSEGMVLAVIGFGALWPMLLATIHGISTVEPTLIEVSRALGMRRAAAIAKISLPNALPDIFAALRLGMTVALILAVVGEMLTGRLGLGQSLLLAARSFRAPDLFAGVIILGAIGYAGAALLQALERHLLAWRDRA